MKQSVFNALANNLIIEFCDHHGYAHEQGEPPEESPKIKCRHFS